MDENKTTSEIANNESQTDIITPEQPCETPENISPNVCRNCGTTIEDGQQICPQCGTPQNELQKYVCSNCGTELLDEQKFCPKCGTPKVEEKKLICTKCGNEMQEGQKFCAKCGQKVELKNDANSKSFISILKKLKNQKVLIPIVIVLVIVLSIVFALLFKGPSIDDIKLSESFIDLRSGDSKIIVYTITPEESSDAEVTWESSDESVATVSNSGEITAISEGLCTITATVGKQTDSIKVTVNDSPNFLALYNEYCESTWADYGSDGSYLSIDTNPYDWDDRGLAYPSALNAIKSINNYFGFPESLTNDMLHTASKDGKQSESFNGVTVSWKYHPDNGLEVTYKAN